MGNCFLYKRRGGSGSKIPDIVKAAFGKIIFLSDSKNAKLKGLRICGKTTQNGTPTPDAPVPLDSVGDGGSVGVTVCGKNLIDFLKAENIGSSPPTSVAITVESNAVTLSGITGGSWVSKRYCFYTPAGTYTLSAKMETDKGYTNISIYTSEQLNGSYVAITNLLSSGTKMFTLSKDCYVEVRLHFTGGNGTGGETWTTRYYNIQIEKGSVATDFEESKVQVLPISTPNGLPGILVSSGGNYTDSTGQQWVCDEVDFARGKYVQRVGKDVLIGTPSFIETADHPGRFAWKNCLSNTYQANAISLSNFAVWGTWSLHNASKTVFSPNTITLYFSPKDSMTADAVDAMFAEMIASDNPPVIIGQLATPIETALTAEQLAAYAELHTNYPSTTLYNDAGAWMEVKYL